MSEKSLATQIVEGLGGADNIVSIENCMTRLRTVVKDGSLINREVLSAVKGVMRLTGTDSQIQIVVGPGVADKVSEEIKGIPGIKLTYNQGEAVMTKKSATGILAIFAKVFTPLIPVITASP